MTLRPTLDVVLIEVLAVPDCPNAPVLLSRVREVVGDDVQVVMRVLSLDDGVPRGFAGSPTLLVDGENPFGNGDLASGIACSLWLPSTQELRAVLRSD